MAEVVNLMEKSEEKKKALEAALSQIEKNYGKGSVMKLGDPENIVEIESISTSRAGLPQNLTRCSLSRHQLARPALQNAVLMKDVGGLAAFPAFRIRASLVRPRASSSRVARRRRHRARTHDRPVRRGAVLELYRHAFVGEFLQKPHELHGVASPSSVVDARRARDVRATASVRVRVLEPRSFSGARVGARGKARLYKPNGACCQGE